MTTLSHDDASELLGAHALDALDADEAAQLEAHVAACEPCAVELGQMRGVAGMIATTTDEVPARVWDAIAAEIADTVPAAAGRRHRAQRYSRHVPLRHAVFAAVVAIVVVGAISAELVHIADRSGGAGAPVSASLASLVTALDNPHSEFVSLDAIQSHEGALARIVVSPTGTAYVFDTVLPPLKAGETYQLWGLRGGHYMSLGLLGNRPSLIEFRINPHEVVTYYAVTIEHAGGVDVMNHRPVAEGVVQGA